MPTGRRHPRLCGAPPHQASASERSDSLRGSARIQRCRGEAEDGCALGEGFILEPQGLTHPAVTHLVIEGSPEAFHPDCSERDPHRRVAVHGYEALLIDCPETAGLHASHVLLRWVEEGIFVTVSSHGHTEANRHLVQEIARDIRLVAPRKSS